MMISKRQETPLLLLNVIHFCSNCLEAYSDEDKAENDEEAQLDNGDVIDNLGDITDCYHD